jgi:hypothetical protein
MLNADMPNPPLLLCDSDALVQFFVIDDLRPLQSLKATFQIQPTITLEVDLELRWLGKHKNAFVPKLDRALKHGILVKLDQGMFQGYLGTVTAGTSWASYQALGARYYGFVQKGEAYTHAAAVSLAMPALSNDGKAVRVLEGQMMSVAVPVLRFFDIIIFAHAFGVLTTKECEDIRSTLMGSDEGIPGPFERASFVNGAKNFPCRLRAGSASAGPYPPPTNHYDPLTIIP